MIDILPTGSRPKTLNEWLVEDDLNTEEYGDLLRRAEEADENYIFEENQEIDEDDEEIALLNSLGF